MSESNPSGHSISGPGLGALSEPESREDLSAITDSWVESIATNGTDESRPILEDYLRVQAEFPNRSWRNVLLILSQRPSATVLRDRDSWRKQYRRTVNAGEDPIWLWQPISAKCCPRCGNSPEYHEKEFIECDNHQTGRPEYWPTGVVGTKPAPYFDVAQTTGQPVEMEGADLRALSDRGVWKILKEIIAVRGYSVESVDPYRWEYDEAAVVATDSFSFEPVIRYREAAIQDWPGDVLYSVLRALKLDGDVDYVESRLVSDCVAAGVVKLLGLDISSPAHPLERFASDPAGVRTQLTKISRGMDRFLSLFEQTVVRLQSEFES